jgi:hypothetical protein
MISAAPYDLASSMIRLHGKEKALSLAQQYASNPSASGDHHAHKKWAAVVVAIAAMIDVTKRYNERLNAQSIAVSPRQVPSASTCRSR